jgi:hypothetical protein
MELSKYEDIYKEQENIDEFFNAISKLDKDVIVAGFEAMKYIFQLRQEN